MASTTAKAKAKATPLSDQEIQQKYVGMQNELQSLASKIGELESEAEEHTVDPDRKCFRLIGGVLAERTVKEVFPALKTTRDGILKVVSNLGGQYKAKEEEFDSFKREYGIRPVSK
ncbi:hypothetical protein DFP72DRAFT_878310 [Ephemerocybe angulata]|uniref:Prefoldin subunit 2 n=1 Tax=Ephemerocybe angulata TaxID=980116 RepID=A0A8H6MFH9_9AGAR|nr:hypothetical protein DFP72DRAFT_878310 [Tulosesus angulatus]